MTYRYYRFFRFLLLCLYKVLFRIEVQGKELLPQKGPFLLASNHLSNLDPPLLGIIYPHILTYLAKEELFRNKLFGHILINIGAIPFKREAASIKNLRLCLQVLKSRPLLLFPQGTRGVSFEEANSGVGFLYKKSKVPLIVARICGTDTALPKGRKLPRRVTLRVVFGRVDTIEKSDSYEDVTRKVMEKISRL